MMETSFHIHHLHRASLEIKRMERERPNLLFQKSSFSPKKIFAAVLRLKIQGPEENDSAVKLSEKCYCSLTQQRSHKTCEPPLVNKLKICSALTLNNRQSVIQSCLRPHLLLLVLAWPFTQVCSQNVHLICSFCHPFATGAYFTAWKSNVLTLTHTHDGPATYETSRKSLHWDGSIWTLSAKFVLILLEKTTQVISKVYSTNW